MSTSMTARGFLGLLVFSRLTYSRVRIPIKPGHLFSNLFLHTYFYQHRKVQIEGRRTNVIILNFQKLAAKRMIFRTIKTSENKLDKGGKLFDTNSYTSYLHKPFIRCVNCKYCENIVF